MGSTRSTSGGEGRSLLSQYVEDVRRLGIPSGASTTDGAPAPLEPVLDPQVVKSRVEPHLFFVVQVAHSMRCRGIPIEDLIAEGNIGLLEAAQRFDASRGVRFLTYAAWWVRKRMLDYVAREGNAVHLTRHAREQRRLFLLVEAQLADELGRTPTTEELSVRLGVGTEAVRRSIAARVRVVSIDDTPEEGAVANLAERLPDSRTPPADHQLDVRRQRSRVLRELERLSERERFIVRSRFGLDGHPLLTFQQISDRLGISRERTRQLGTETLLRLRRRLGESATVHGTQLAPRYPHRVRSSRRENPL